MGRIKVAIVDTGINARHPYFEGYIKEIYEYRKDGGKVVRVNRLDICNDENGHGTMCTSTILSENKNIDIYSFKMMDEEGIGNLQGLEAILSFLCELDVDIINMSLAVGDGANLTDLESILTCLERQGKIMVAALENRKNESYPACFPQCFGCRGFIVEEMGAIWFNGEKNVQCIVDSTPFLECDLNKGYKMEGKSNSFATAKLTGLISRNIPGKRGNKREEIEKHLFEIAYRTDWEDEDLIASKRYPELDLYREQPENLVREVENIVKYYLKLDAFISLKEKGLFSGEIGLQYKDCYQLLQLLQKELGFHVIDYTKISREDFYTVNHICHLIQRSKIE